MNKTILTIILGVALISLASALYGGECLEVDLSELESLDNLVYTVVGNSSNLIGLTINFNGTEASICTPINYKPDSFTIVFLNNLTQIVVKEVHVGGGGGSSKTIYKNVTEYIEVDNYLDREIIVEAEEKEVEEKKPISLFWVFVSFILVLGVIILIIWLVKPRKQIII